MENLREYRETRGILREMEDESSAAARLLRRAVGEALTERQAQMVRMYYLQQMPMRAVAETLGVNQSTVSRTLKTAREKLRRCLSYSGIGRC